MNASYGTRHLGTIIGNVITLSIGQGEQKMCDEDIGKESWTLLGGSTNDVTIPTAFILFRISAAMLLLRT